MIPVLNVGFENYVMSDNVVAIVDYQLAAAKRLVSNARKEKPRNIINLTNRSKIRSLIVCTGDRYVLSAVHRQQLVSRLLDASGDRKENS